MIFPVPGLPHLLHQFGELLPASRTVLDVQGPAVAEGRQIAAGNGIKIIAIPCCGRLNPTNQTSQYVLVNINCLTRLASAWFDHVLPPSPL